MLLSKIRRQGTKGKDWSVLIPNEAQEKLKDVEYMKIDIKGSTLIYTPLTE